MYSTRTQHTVAIYPADKPGPAHKLSQARVIFRINGEKLLRYFDGNEQARKTPRIATPAQWCQEFIDVHCRGFLRLDGYNPEKREWIKYEVIDCQVDYFQCDHPEVTI